MARLLVTLVLGLAFISGCDSDASGPVEVLDLDGRSVDPLAIGDTDVRVFLFTRTDCPISNRFAPEVNRIVEAFDDDVTFWLVYPNPDVTVEAIRKHAADFGYTCAALRDPEHALVRLTEAKVTPEAALFDASGTLAYCGRIDDRFVDFGKARETPTHRDLEDAIGAVLDGRPVEAPRTDAVGCLIVDLK